MFSQKKTSTGTSSSHSCFFCLIPNMFDRSIRHNHSIRHNRSESHSGYTVTKTEKKTTCCGSSKLYTYFNIFKETQFLGFLLNWFGPTNSENVCLVQGVSMCQYSLPSWEITYPTKREGQDTHLQKCQTVGAMLVPRRVFFPHDLTSNTTWNEKRGSTHKSVRKVLLVKCIPSF